MKESIKVCKKCGVKKPVNGFHTGYGICKQCRAQCSRDCRVRWSVENRKLYGTACTPTELKKARECYIRRKTENMKLYGATRTPTGWKRDREYHVGKGNKKRMQALTLLGSVCTCCGESRLEMLTFHHIHGGGNKSRTSGDGTVNEILTMESPTSKYRTLCWNCNISLGFYGYCPHQGRPPKEEPVSSTQERVEYGRQLCRRYKLEFIAEFGGK